MGKIVVKKEPEELYEDFRIYENCVFCNEKTDTWHSATNSPVCSNCAKENDDVALYLQPKYFKEPRLLNHVFSSCINLETTSVKILKKMLKGRTVGYLHKSDYDKLRGFVSFHKVKTVDCVIRNQIVFEDGDSIYLFNLLEIGIF